MARALSPALAGIPRVDLMPRTEIARRERDQLVRVWVWAVLGAPQVPTCQDAVAVSVSPENPATICVPMQRPPVSFPRV